MRNLKDANREKLLRIKHDVNELTRENPYFSLLISPVLCNIWSILLHPIPPNSFLKCG